jgi:hypothetical protein
MDVFMFTTERTPVSLYFQDLLTVDKCSCVQSGAQEFDASRGQFLSGPEAEG